MHPPPWRKMEQPYSPNLSDLAECVILCTSWLQSPGKVSWICDLRTRYTAILGWLFSAELEFLKKSMGARHRGGIGFLYHPAMLHRLEEFIPWNQFRGPINI